MSGVPEYTVLAIVSVIVVLAVEHWWWHTGLLRSAQYWLSMVIVFAFMVLVDGWLTKLSDPIVLYDSEQTTGLRFPWDIPVEDFLFGFTLITLTMLLWVRRTRTART